MRYAIFESHRSSLDAIADSGYRVSPQSPSWKPPAAGGPRAAWRGPAPAAGHRYNLAVPIVAAAILPHAPILVPEIGGEQRRAVPETVAALEKVSAAIAA